MADTDYSGEDKLVHAGVCFLIALYSTEAAMVAAVTKEYADSRTAGNHWCVWDMLADMIGIAVGTVIRVLIIARWNWL